MTTTDLAAMAAAGRRRLEAAGFDAAKAGRDAVLLARSVLGWSAAEWLTRSDQAAPPNARDRFLARIERRASREPIAYITGEREFYGRAFKVTRAVLIPRPESEFVVEEALLLLARRAPGSHAPFIVDVGTGSGCLGVTLALEYPEARVVATDISGAAIAVATENAQALGAGDRVEFREGAFLAGIDGPIDLVVANPPYVAETDRPAMAPDVKDFEPAVALFGGQDGLDTIRALLPLVSSALAPGGWLVMEMGCGQEDAVRALIAQTSGLACSHVREDLQGIPRVALVRSSKSEV